MKEQGSGSVAWRRRVFLVMVAAGLVAGAAGRAQAVPSKDWAPTKMYTDEAAKVSFRYPSVWTLSDQYGSYFGAAIAPHSEPMQAVATFSAEGNLYAQTNLEGIDFLYRRTPGLAMKDCMAIVAGHEISSAGKPLPQVTINGVRFTHLATGDAGMSKSVSEEVYVTQRQGTCFLFEEDMYLVGEGVKGTRQLTARETAALRRHLGDVMQTVTFSR